MQIRWKYYIPLRLKKKTPEGSEGITAVPGQRYARQEILNNHDQKFLASAAINKRHELQPRPYLMQGYFQCYRF